MKQLIIRLLLALTLAACMPVAGALDLYRGEAAINDESDKGRAASIRQAFRQVLVKVAGSEERIGDPALMRELSRAQDHVLSYGFRDSAGGDEPQRWLQVQFSPDAVEQILSDHGVPVWHANRPRLLVWLGLEQDGGRRIAQPGVDDVYLTLTRHAAEARGLPTLFPLMDLEDQGRLSAEQLWAERVEALRLASERYAADVVLSGVLRSDEGGGWRGRWTLLDEGVRASWNNAGGSLRSMVYQALDVAADKLAQRYAPSSSSTTPAELLTIRVEELRSTRDYARVNGLINGLGSVALATIARVTPESVDYQLRMRGGIAALKQEIALGGILQPVADAAAAPSGSRGELLRYRLGF